MQLERKSDKPYRCSPFGLHSPNASAVILLPNHIWIDRQVLDLGDLFFFWILSEELIHDWFVFHNGISRSLYPYHQLMISLVFYSLTDPGNPDSDKCLSIALDIADKLDLIHRTGVLASETFVSLVIETDPDSMTKSMIEYVSKRPDWCEATKLPVTEFVERMRKRHREASLDSGDEHTEAIFMMDKLLEITEGVGSKASHLIFEASLIGLSDLDLVSISYDELASKFETTPELYDRDFRLRCICERQTVPMPSVPPCDAKGLCYYPEALEFRQFFSARTDLPWSYRQLLDDVPDYINLMKVDDFFPQEFAGKALPLFFAKLGYGVLVTPRLGPVPDPIKELPRFTDTILRLYVFDKVCRALRHGSILPNNVILTIEELFEQISKDENAFFQLPPMEKSYVLATMRLAKAVEQMGTTSNSTCLSITKLAGMDGACQLWTPQRQAFWDSLEECEKLEKFMRTVYPPSRRLQHGGESS